MALNHIKKYFESKTFKPYFVSVGDKTYNDLLVELNLMQVDFINLSDYCLYEDKFPDIDKLRNDLLTVDVDYNYGNIIVLGLGEWLALMGSKKTYEILNQFKDFRIGTAHVCFLLRFIHSELLMIEKNDIRFDYRRYFISDDSISNLSISLCATKINDNDLVGIKNYLKCLEKGFSGEVVLNSNHKFLDSLLPIHFIKNHYDAIKRLCFNFSVSKECGSDDNWEFLLSELNTEKSLENVFSKFNLNFDENSFCDKLFGSENVNWLYYLYLKFYSSNISNKYVQFTLKYNVSFEEYRQRFLSFFIDVNHKDAYYEELYLDRKKMIKYFSEPEIAAFVNLNKENIEESVYRLTDYSLVEKQEIITYISLYGIPKCLSFIYNDLYLYLKNYSFVGNGDYYKFLSLYFTEYKNCKISNKISTEMLDMVDKESKNRNYNRLSTRDSIVLKYNKKGNFLCWIDALGVEYLSYIYEKANNKGLMVSINVGRSELPTITTINKSFYNDWSFDKRKEERLDDIKHKDKGGYFYGPSNLYPIHLASELEVIDHVINDAAVNLALRKYDNYIIASDHGSSRLSVIYKKEEKYDTDTHGEHSGRCCKSFSGYDLPFATEENGYIVLADYGRFKGSRAANVEVHGGACLEEVLVPIISLSLKDSSIIIKIVNNNVKVDYKTPAEFDIYINKKISDDLNIKYENTIYKSTLIDDNHYKIVIDDIKKAGVYMLDAYIGSNLMTRLELVTKGKSAAINDDFDF